MFKSVLNAGEKAFKKLFEKGNYEPNDLLQIKEFKDLLYSTNELFSSSIKFEVSDALKDYLKRDVFIFSGLKTHAQLSDARSYLQDENGAVRSYDSFKQKILKLNAQYNQNYLQAEYNFAIQSGLSAEKWETFSDDDKRYYLQYRTAKDDKVRYSHAALDEITLPKSDPFWRSYMPPNGWNCRCTTVEVLSNDYSKDDSSKAIAAGEIATTQIGKNGKNKAEIFRFNPGAEKRVFPKNNAYSKVVGSNEVVKILSEKTGAIDLSKFIDNSVSQKNVDEIMKEYASRFPENFANGLEQIKFSKAKGYLMQHSVYKTTSGVAVSKSTLSISTHTFKINNIEFNAAKELADGLLNIKKGIDLTFNQEYAFESLWHEILHAKTRSKHYKLGESRTEIMETINQFVARHTYPDFIKSFGGKAIHQGDVLKNGYGYNTFVQSFRSEIEALGIEEKEVVRYLSPHLLNDYTTLRQKQQDCFNELRKK